MGLTVAFMLSYSWCPSFTSIYFDEKQLQDHLYDCYKQGRLIPFPSAKKNVRRNTAKSISFELFCSCRMPWAKQNARSVELQMAECDSCMEWFHRKCQRIPDKVFLRIMEWLCKACFTRTYFFTQGLTRKNTQRSLCKKITQETLQITVFACT